MPKRTRIFLDPVPTIEANDFDLTHPLYASLPPEFVGDPSEPKTQVLEAFAAEQGVQIVTLVAGPAEYEDYCGLPNVDFSVNLDIDGDRDR